MAWISYADADGSNKKPPTITRLAADLGISVSTARRAFRDMQSAGVIRLVKRGQKGVGANVWTPVVPALRGSRVNACDPSQPFTGDAVSRSPVSGNQYTPREPGGPTVPRPKGLDPKRYEAFAGALNVQRFGSSDTRRLLSEAANIGEVRRAAEADKLLHWIQGDRRQSHLLSPLELAAALSDERLASLEIGDLAPPFG
jgi:hypothetical protein